MLVGNVGGAEVYQTHVNSRDLLTLIDPLCKKTIHETILSCPPFQITNSLGKRMFLLAKEASAAASDAAKLSSSDWWLWIVNPVDGTTNFVHGMPLCMPSVATSYKGEVVVGVIYDLHLEKHFTPFVAVEHV